MHFKAVEIDIQMSKDNEIVVFHDTSSLKRLLKVEKNDNYISNLTLKEMRQYKYKVNGNSAIDYIPTLEEFLQKADSLNPNMKFMIESKEWSKPLIMAEKLSFLFKKYNLYDRAVIGSFNPIFLYIMRSVDYNIVTLLLVERYLMSDYIYDETSIPDWYLEMNPFAKFMLTKFAPMIDYFTYIRFDIFSFI